MDYNKKIIEILYMTFKFAFCSEKYYISLYQLKKAVKNIFKHDLYTVYTIKTEFLYKCTYVNLSLKPFY